MNAAPTLGAFRRLSRLIAWAFMPTRARWEFRGRGGLGRGLPGIHAHAREVGGLHIPSVSLSSNRFTSEVTPVSRSMRSVLIS